MAETATRIWVGIRARPLDAGTVPGFEFNPNANTVSAVDDVNRTAYSFDRVFDCTSENREVYEYSTQRVVEGVLTGINGTVFAYGQTGSGKTHTMSALTRMAVAEMLEKTRVETVKQYKLRVSLVELYCERVRDLLREEKVSLGLRLDPVRGWTVEGVTEAPIVNMEQFETLLKDGEARRATGNTAMNDRSSRSHSILSLWVESVTPAEAEEPVTRLACLNMVDLAGSEGQKTAQTTGQRQMEGKDINLSLLALSKMLRDCSEGQGANKPYRDSRLTMLLRSAIGGNCWTSMLGCIAPNSEHKEQSLQTLDFASRAKLVSNKVTVNVLEDPLTAMTKENLRLKRHVESLQIKNDSLTARIRRAEPVGKTALPVKGTPRGTPLRHSHGGTPFGGVWSAVQFMKSVKRPDLTARKPDGFATARKLAIPDDDDNDLDIIVPATPLPAKSSIPLFQLEDSPPRLCDIPLPSEPDAKLEAPPPAYLHPPSSKPPDSNAAKTQLGLAEDVAKLKSQVSALEAQLVEAHRRTEQLTSENGSLKALAAEQQAGWTSEKQALTKRLEGEQIAAQRQLSREGELEDLVAQLRAQLRAQAEDRELQAAKQALYQDQEKEALTKWRQERMKLKEEHATEILKLQKKHEEDIKTTTKLAREQNKARKVALAEVVKREKELLQSLETARQALQSKAGDVAVAGSVTRSMRRRAVPQTILTDITNTVKKHRPDDPKKNLSFVSTAKKPRPLRMEYKIAQKPCKRLKLSGEEDVEDMRSALVQEIKRKNEALKTKRKTVVVNEVERNLWKNHKFGTEFSKDMMPKDDQEYIVESIIWADLVEPDGEVPTVVVRCRFKEWWNGEYIGHMPDKERDAYVAGLGPDLGTDVLLRQLEAPDLLQFFSKNLVTYAQWQFASDSSTQERAKKGGATQELDSSMAQSPKF